MAEEYLEFMVFELDDSGERIQLDMTEDEFREDNGTNLLHPEQVAVIVKEGLRRIFIWKGAKSPVRKRFISSRVANQLQKELVEEASFHRCKIVSVDQGDEPTEFLDAFNFESMEVKERMADMRYVRNVEKDTTKAKGKVVESSTQAEEKEDEYYSPALEELKRQGKDISGAMESSKTSSNSTSRPSGTGSRPSKPTRRPAKRPTRKPTSSYKKSKMLSTEDIIEKIVENDPPENYKRQNLIIQNQLFGATSKTTSVFGENVEEIEWERVLKLPEGVHILENYIFRIYCNVKRANVIGIEILKSEEDSEHPSNIERTSIDISEIQGEVEEKILELDPPENYYRQNLIVGKKLYGYISKKVEVLGEQQEEEEWTLVKNIPKKVITLEDNLFRIYFNEEKKQIDAVEILQKGTRKGKILPGKKEIETEKDEEKQSSEEEKEEGEDNKKQKDPSNKEKDRELPSIPSNN
jgi:hypothetical protein